MCLVSLALAQEGVIEVPVVNVQAFRPASGGPGLWTDITSTPRGIQTSARLLVHGSKDPLVFLSDTGEEVALLSDVLEADLVAATRYRFLELALGIPFFPTEQGSHGQETGLGDLTTSLGFSAWDGSSQPVGLGGRVRVSYPTATVWGSLGDPAITVEPTLVVDRRREQAWVAGNLGLRLGPRVELQNVVLDDALVARILAGAVVGSGALGLELAGHTPVGDGGPRAAASGLEWLASLAVPLGDQVRFHGALGTGLAPGIGNPDYRFLLGMTWDRTGGGEGWSLGKRDQDGDRVADGHDGCPAEAEDRDGFQDGDGCPDPDNDQDGLADGADTCPTEPEDGDGVRDTDGCPEPEALLTIRLTDQRTGEPVSHGRVRVTTSAGTVFTASGRPMEVLPGTCSVVARGAGYQELVARVEAGTTPTVVELALLPERDGRISIRRERIELMEPIVFAPRKSQVSRKAGASLDEVAQVLRDHPEIRRVRVEGHADPALPPAVAMGLSKERAEAARAWLVRRGVPEDRLEVQALGGQRPLPGSPLGPGQSHDRVELAIEAWVEEPPVAPEP